MKNKYLILSIGFILGLGLGLGLSVLFFSAVRKSDLRNFQNFVAYKTAIDQICIKSAKQGEDKQILAALQLELVIDYARLTLARRNYVNISYTDDIYNSVTAYFKEHPEEWNWLPDKNLKMLPGDPTLPAELNVHALIESELKNGKA